MKVKKQIKKDILKLLNDAEFDGLQKSKILNRIVNYTYGIAKKDVSNGCFAKLDVSLKR